MVRKLWKGMVIKMKKTIHKMFWAWDFEKEEQWLNEMSAKGLQLYSVGFCKYVFEEGPPGEYIYRLELLDNVPSNAESIQYIHFLQDTGAEHIGSLFRWVYFRKKSNENGFDLFSDIDSRIKHLDRILLIVGIVTGLNLFNGFNNMHLGSSVNLMVGMLCLLVASILGYGFLRLLLKKRKLEKEKVLHE